MSASEIERIRTQLKRLALPTMAQRFEDAAATAAKSEQSYTAFRGGLADEELAAKLDRSVSIRLSKAGLPAIRTLEEFDFAFQPSLPAARIRELGELGFIDHKENLVFVGRPGTGKTHLATALAVRACHGRRRVQFLAAPVLVEQLLAAEVARSLGKQLEGWGRLDVLVIDELGYLPMDAHRANLFFQLISQLYTRTAIILTSNVVFDGWGRIFGGDEMMAAAILDRLLHYSHIFLINGPSYRMKDKQASLANGGAAMAPPT
jgi:DNA replication protein DnaC